MPTVTIDGQRLEFAPGQSIIEVATKAGIEIPYYCWHAKLSVAANCRMCLVEVEKAPKLVPSCQTPCADGMVVRTTSEKVKETQRSVHEFLLLNHPVDCPICDQAGECKLQNYYMTVQLTKSPMREPRLKKHKREELGPYVIYDAERCIMCTRCVRFMEEVAKERQLGVFQRGNHAEIGTFPGQPLDHPYSLNVVDLCPVGALTSSVFRFKQRVWYLTRSPSICSGCAKGCNIHIDQRSSIVYRLLPRDNDAVNQCWLCDEGRLTYTRANDARLTEPLMREAEAVEPLPVKKALPAAAALLQSAVQAKQPVALALSLSATCEEAFVVGKLARELCGATSVALFGYAEGVADALLKKADKNPNRAGVTAVLGGLGLTVTELAPFLKALNQKQPAVALVLGHELTESEVLAKAMRAHGNVLHVAATRTALAEAARVSFPSVSFAEADGTWISGDGRMQRLMPAFAPTSEARPIHTWVAELAQALGVTWMLGTPATIRAEMERVLPAFAAAKITHVAPQGQPFTPDGA